MSPMYLCPSQSTVIVWCSFMVFSNVFYAEVIDYETELYRSPFVGPEAGGDFALEISMFVESLFKEFLCNDACLW